MAVACAVVAVIFWLKGNPWYNLLILAAVFFILGRFAFPKAMLPFQKVWMGFAVIMSWFMTRLILFILFYIGFTGIRLVAMLFRKNFLELEMDKNVDSYWIKKQRGSIDASSYEKQF